MSKQQAVEQAVKRFSVHGAQEAFEPQPPISWTIENLITAGSVNLFEGNPGSKKTWAFLDLAVCVSIGKDWLGRKTTQGTVLIVDEESGNTRLRRRISQVMRGHLLHQDSIIPPLHWTSLDGLNIGYEDDVEQLKKLIREIDAKLVIIDTLVNVMPGLDENSARDTQPIFKALRILADTLGTTFIVIHHLNKMGGTRGSTAIPGALDLIVDIESQKKSRTIKFVTKKERDIEECTFFAQATFTEDQFWLSDRDAPEETVHLGAGHRHILSYLLEHGRSTRKEILDSSDTTTTKNHLGLLVEKGLIVRANDGAQGKGAEYVLTTSGEASAQKV